MQQNNRDKQELHRALEKRLDFMSQNRSLYPRFAHNDSLFAGVLSMEDSLREMDLFYIPQAAIRGVYDRLLPGDIIATATRIGGLDVSHSGLVYRGEDGRIGFLHASASSGVTIARDLADYVNGVSSQIGIVVARPAPIR